MITVTSNADSGAGTLRQALADATPGEVINFSITGSIVLTTGELGIGQNQTITGPGSGSLTIDGNANSRIFNVTSGIVAISGLTITNGNTVEYGGGIRNSTTLTLSDIIFTSNVSNGGAAGGGGAIYNESTVTMTDCTLDGNQTASGGAHGGGLYNGGTATLNSCTITNNSTNNEGGGIFNDGTCEFSLGLISANSANSALGGGFSNEGTFTLIDSTLSLNTANTAPAISNFAGTVTLRRSTMSGHDQLGNQTILNVVGTLNVENSTLSGNGAAIRNQTGGASTISNSTITNNEVGIYNDNFCFATVYNTIVCGNTGYDILTQASDFSSSGHNIFGQTDPFTAGPGDQNNVLIAAVALGPLQDNGGPTFTHALLEGSVALNAGDNTDAPATDQRGEPRIVAGTIDIGAYESQAAPCPSYSGTLPGWLTIQGNCFVVTPGAFRGSTKAEANAAAQAALDAFIAAGLESGDLNCP